MDKDYPKAPSAEWLSKARERAIWIQGHTLKRTEQMEELLNYLDDKVSWVVSLIEEKECKELK
ncbi:hypothetical protein EI94DRAFT_1808672 [Lactarius quietus]|nr:hypothetical protein EI94DRAFT_1808672 [Lactarius quietus]